MLGSSIVRVRNLSPKTLCKKIIIFTQTKDVSFLEHQIKTQTAVQSVNLAIWESFNTAHRWIKLIELVLKNKVARSQ